MPAYVRVQAQEFAREKDGYTATKHQREAGTGYFDNILAAITGGEAATAALAGSTEAAQFHLNGGAPRVEAVPNPERVVPLPVTPSSDTEPPPIA